MVRSIGSVSGLAALKRRFDLGPGPAVLRDEFRAQAAAMADEARAALEQEHPDGTGALARSVSVRETGDEDAPRFDVGTASPVGRYLEFGTRRMRAQPWLVPALYRRLPAVKSSARRVLRHIFRTDSAAIR